MRETKLTEGREGEKMNITKGRDTREKIKESGMRENINRRKVRREKMNKEEEKREKK